MFANSGEITPPCGVPFSPDGLSTPPSITPTLSQPPLTFHPPPTPPPALEPAADQLQPPLVADPPLHQVHQDVVTDVLVTAFDVGVDDDRLLAERDRPLHLTDRHVRAASRTKAVGTRQKIRLEDRLDHDLDRRLHHSVPDHRYPQRALLRLARFLDPAAAHRLRPIALLAQLLSQLGEKHLHTDHLLDVLETLPVDSGRPVVRPDLLPGHPQHVLPIDLIVEGSKSPTQRLFRCTGKCVLQGSDFGAHVHSLLGTHAPLPALHTRSKQGRTLRTDCSLLPIIASPAPPTSLRPYRSSRRLHPTWRPLTAVGERRGTVGLQVLPPSSVSACRQPYPGSPVGALALCFPTGAGLPLLRTGSTCSPLLAGFSPTRTLPAIPVRSKLTRLHCSLYAAACGFGRHP